MNLKTPLFNTHDLIVVATALAAALMWLLLMLSQRENRVASQALSLFFGSQLTHAICVILLWNQALAPVLEHYQPLITALSVLANTLKGPALFIYICASSAPDFKWRRQHLWHLTLPLTCMLYMLILTATDNGAYTAQTDSRVHDLWLIIKGSAAAYAIAAIPYTLSTQQMLENHYSDESTIGRNWISSLCYGYAAYWSWSFLTQFAGQALAAHWPEGTADTLGIIGNYIAFGLLVTVFAYNASLTHAELSAALRTSSKRQPKKQILEPRFLELASVLTDLMSQQKLYLQANLTAEQLAARLQVSPRELSQLLNQHFKQNFFDFINSYRVNEAKELLKENGQQKKPVTEIIYLSGFNSKSSFQRFFKRCTGVSPSEYRQSFTDHQ